MCNKYSCSKLQEQLSIHLIQCHGSQCRRWWYWNNIHTVVGDHLSKDCIQYMVDETLVRDSRAEKLKV